MAHQLVGGTFVATGGVSSFVHVDDAAQATVLAPCLRFRSRTGWTPRYPSARQGWMATAAVLAAGPQPVL